MTGDEHTAPEFYSYAEFGDDFFRVAVTEDRILAAVSGLSGNAFDFGPMGVGPGRLAKVSAHGTIGAPGLTPVDGTDVAFRLRIPVDVRLLVDLGIDQHRFRADVVVGLHIAARAARPLRVVIDVTPPTTNDVDVTVRSESTRASLLRLVACIDGELRRFVAKYVAREIDKPHLRAAREIDVAARLAKAWTAAPQGVSVDIGTGRGRSST
jgi:hypothetical protein